MSIKHLQGQQEQPETATSGAAALERRTALEWFEAGFGAAVLPIIPPGALIGPASKIGSQIGKIPGRRHASGLWCGFVGWQRHETTAAQAREYDVWGANVGLRADEFPCIDCDVDEPLLARTIADAVAQHLGRERAVLRTRPNSARCLFICRTGNPFKKTRYEFADSEGGRVGAVEVLGRGNQYVVAGQHHSGVDHRLERLGVDLTTPPAPSDLPEISSEWAVGALRDLLQSVADQHGLTLHTKRRAADEGPPPDQDALRAEDVSYVRELVEHVPNDAQCDRDFYITMAYAIKAAMPAGCDADGGEIFLEWAARWESGANRDYDRRTYDGLSGPYLVGVEWLERQAQAHGYDMASRDFSVVVDAQPGPWDAVSLKSAHAAGTTPSDPAPAIHGLAGGEQVASLHGFAGRAFLSVVDSCADGDMEGLHRRLVTTAGTTHLLGETFEGVVLPEAKRISGYADEPARFAKLLSAGLSAVPAWRSLTVPQQQLLTHAAYLLLAKASRLIATLTDSPGQPLPLDVSEPEYLIDGLIPRQALCALVAPPKQGKTFVALELAARVAKEPDIDPVIAQCEEEMFGGRRRIAHGPVLYFASEGQQGLRARVARWSLKHEGGKLPHLHLFGRVPPLEDPARAIGFILEAMRQVLKEGTSPALLVIDVLRAAFAGEENSSDTMIVVTKTAEILARLTGATVLLVHHSTKADPSELRGSSALAGALDYVGVVSTSAQEVSLRTKFQKDGPADQAFRWRLQEGVLVEGREVTGGRPVEQEVLAPEEYVARAVREIASDGHGVSRADLHAALQEYGPPHFKGKDHAPRSARNRAINKAISAGYVMKTKANEYAPGPTMPKAEVLTPGDLEELLGCKSSGTAA